MEKFINGTLYFKFKFYDRLSWWQKMRVRLFAQSATYHIPGDSIIHVGWRLGDTFYIKELWDSHTGTDRVQDAYR